MSVAARLSMTTARVASHCIAASPCSRRCRRSSVAGLARLAFTRLCFRGGRRGDEGRHITPQGGEFDRVESGSARDPITAPGLVMTVVVGVVAARAVLAHD